MSRTKNRVSQSMAEMERISPPIEDPNAALARNMCYQMLKAAQDDMPAAAKKMSELAKEGDKEAFKLMSDVMLAMQNAQPKQTIIVQQAFVGSGKSVREVEGARREIALLLGQEGALPPLQIAQRISREFAFTASILVDSPWFKKVDAGWDVTTQGRQESQFLAVETNHPNGRLQE